MYLIFGILNPFQTVDIVVVLDETFNRRCDLHLCEPKTEGKAVPFCSAYSRIITMLKLHAGRENIAKERFIYDSIKESGAKTLVLVPNQYTLAAEEQALLYLETDCLFDVEVLSMNRLGLRMLQEQGSESVRMLDKYGRFMLLTKLIKERKESFDIFRRMAGRVTFTNMLNDFISEFKQQNLNADELEEMLDDAKDIPLLQSKIKELSSVIKSYEDSIKGLYTDPEDYISMYIDAIEKSEMVKGKSIWVYGYDSVTPKFTNALMELSKKADEVNFIINRSDFGLDEQLESLLRRRAAEEGIEVSCEEIDDSYSLRKTETIERIEKYLWRETDPKNPTGNSENSEFVPEDLTLVCAANPYYEAENAAAYIWHLVRDLGYKMSDIQVIANDEGGMQPIIRRVFAEYGLPVFSDAVRRITDTAAVAFMVNLLRFEQYNRSPQFIFAMLKSGMTDFADEDVESLENYVRNYRIRGSMWDREFKYGEDQMGAETFARLNEMRAVISDAMKGMGAISKNTKVGDFTENFKSYLESTWKLTEKVNDAASLAAEDGFSDEAQRLVQSYEKAIEMLAQMSEIMGDEELKLDEFTELYVAGLLDVEVGVIPDAADGLSLGTMIRTRPRPMKAAVVLGANEGVLPLQPSTEGLFSIDEKDFFRERGFVLGALDEVRMNEENAAMYRMMSAPSDKLYISYSMTDTSGNDANQSPLIDSLSELFPQIEEKGLIKKDIISEGWGMDMVQTADDALRHLAVHIKDSRSHDEDGEELTRAMIKWYRDNRKKDLDIMLAASEYDNEMKALGAGIASKLYKGNRKRLKLSASSIGNYFDCPFKYYVNNGLSPQEERDFATDPRSVGDAYHECLMAVAAKLVRDRALLDAIKDGDDEALEKMERIREICAKAAKAMASQLGAETVSSAAFEESFGRGGAFEPIKIKIGDEEVYVEGKIDRADVLNVNGDERVRIIDYKTGADSLDLWKMRQGYRMQLMIYLISATSGDYEPAGMFYFNIKDPIQSANNAKKGAIESMSEADPEDMFKLKGAYINEEGVLSAMPKEVLSKPDKGGGISRSEFEEARADVMSRMQEAASGILNGDISIHPLRESGSSLACRRCSYASVCRRGGEYPGNYSKKLKPKPKADEEQS